MPEARRADVAEIVKSAFERDSSEWPRFLDQACGLDTDLRAEVESLLTFGERAPRFIDEPAVHLAADLLAENENLQPDERLDQYEICSLIGTGGMGEVYLARDTELGRKVALKLVKSGLGTASIIRHFHQEERILAGLNHPHIARLYGGGVTPKGVPYFIMEYVEGERLDEYCNNRRLTTCERLNLFRKVCLAVTYAHQNLVIHRDLKPANIRVTAEGEPKLLDFGIAKLIDLENAPASGPTLSLQGVMTPEYASPEQVAGGKITTASDVYGLGVVLYNLLTGQSPYRTKTNRLAEIARAIAEQDPERPSTAVSRDRKSEARPFEPDRKALRGDVDNIILMAMRKEPARRYASVAQFSEDIRRHLDGLPVIARKDTFTYRSSKFIARNKIGVAAAVLLFLAIVAGLTVSIWQARVAARQRDQARQEKAKAEAINNFLQVMLGASSPESQLRQQKDDLRVKDVLDDASKRLATEDLSDQPEVKAELQRIIGTTYLFLGQYDLAEQNLSSALEAQTRIYGPDSLETLKTLVPLGDLWIVKGDHTKAEKFYRQKLSILRAELKKQTISADYLVLALGDFALLRRAQGDSKEAELLLREELALDSQASPDSKSALGMARAVLALTLADQGDFDAAIKMVRTELAAMREQPKDGTPEFCATLTGLGSFLLEKGELAEAEENLHRAEAIYRRLYNHSHLQLGDNLRLQAQALYLEHKYAEAEAKIDKTLEIYRATTNTNYVNFPTALMVQGLIYGNTQRTAEAEKLLREAVRIRSENVPETHFLRATANGALGEFLTTQRRFPEAEPLLVSSYESLKQSQNASSPRMRLALERLVELYEKWQKPDLATKYRATP